MNSARATHSFSSLRFPLKWIVKIAFASLFVVFALLQNGGRVVKADTSIGTDAFGENLVVVMGNLMTDKVGTAPPAITTDQFSVNATLTVINLNDSGPGSLRQAIIDANGLAGDDTITFQSGLSGTISLTTGELAINGNTSIIGPGGNPIAVERSTAGGTANFRVFNIAAGTDVSISNLTIRNGRLQAVSGSSVVGGGVLNAGNLSLANVTITGNSVAPAAGSNMTQNSGGGIYNTGTFTLTNSTVNNNTASGALRGDGGGINNAASGITTVSNTTINGNISVTNKSGSTNSGPSQGGGIFNAGTVNLINSTLSNSSVNGRSGWGAGIHNVGTLSLKNSTVSRNDATADPVNGDTRGGGIYSSGTITLDNSTVSGNRALTGTSKSGGGIWTLGTASLESVTVYGNSAVPGSLSSPSSGGGIRSLGTVHVRNTIIAGNDANSSPDAEGSIVSDGNNLIGIAAGGSWTSTDLTNQSARLLPLENYGGPTETVALQPNSPAINNGNSSNTAATDQRGFARIVGSAVDIGAFESNIICAFSLSPESQQFPVGGGNGSFSITVAGTDCTWSAVTDSPWINITSGGGTGNGSVNFTVQANIGVARTGTITVGGQTFTVSQAPSCNYVITPASANFSQNGGNGVFGLNVLPGCQWTATTTSPWITVTSTGSGNGQIQFSVAGNAGPIRTGTIAVADKSFTITQASGCTYSLTPSNVNMPNAGGPASFNVTTTSVCPWTATTSAAWINITSGAGTGNGTVSFTVQVNSGPSRSDMIAVGGQTFTVNQAGNCLFSLNPTSTNFPSAGGSGSFNVLVFSDCTWSATSNAPWIFINSGTGTGAGTVTYTVQPNAQPSRTGTITVAGQTFTIDQASGCSFTLSSTSANFTSLGGAGSYTVNSGGGCTWTAVSNIPWITISSGATGTGSGNVGFSVQANPGRIRSGTITAGGQTFTVNQSGRTQPDFDGDGKSDVSVWRESDGNWYFLNSSNGTLGSVHFGAVGDRIVPGDYDNDGKTDFAVWRPSGGVWYLQRSSAGFAAFQFGLSTDLPAQGDFDGDGQTDLAVFRPSNGTWFLQQNTAGFSAVQFGANGDRPVPGDYDGDGKADVAVYRPSEGNWYELRSTQGFAAFHFGIPTDKVVPADYDGDGKTDLAVYRDGTPGIWYLQQSTDGFSAFSFGTTNDIPSPGDFDGDRKADISVFRPSNGTWFSQQTTSGFVATQFGQNGDKPVPSGYVPVQ